MKTGLNNLTNEEILEAEDALNPFAFERYCGSCYYFNTPECKHLEKDPDAEWKRLGRDCFWD